MKKLAARTPCLTSASSDLAMSNANGLRLKRSEEYTKEKASPISENFPERTRPPTSVSKAACILIKFY